MNTKSIIIIIAIIVIMILIGIFLRFVFPIFLFTSVMGEKVDSNTIINAFENNKTLFNEAVEELAEYEEVYFDRDNGHILIYKFIWEDEKYNKVEFKQEEFEKTVYLMNELNLERIAKKYGNTSFMFNAMIKSGQYIVNLNNEAKFKWGYHVTDMKKINDNNWYYIETK